MYVFIYIKKNTHSNLCLSNRARSPRNSGLHIRSKVTVIFFLFLLKYNNKYCIESIINVALFSSDTDRGRTVRHDSPESSPVQKVRHDSPDLSPKRARHDSPDLSPLRRGRHDSPDLSPQSHRTENKNRWHDSSSPSPPRKSQKSSPSRTQRQNDKGMKIHSPIRNNIYTMNVIQNDYLAFNT